MKTIIILITLISNLAFAYDGFDNITEVSNTVAQVASVDANISSIKLSNSGVLTVIRRDKTSQTLVLSDANRESLLLSAQTLSETDIQTDIHTMICKIFLNPFFIQNLSIYDSTTNSMRLVLSMSSCALTSYTHPKDEHMTQIAHTLKSQMIVLAQQIIE